MKQPKVSVVIPVRNEVEKIEQCLKAVLSQTHKSYEVMIVDGHSDDGTVEILKKFPVKILYEDYYNRAGACQVGIENAKGEYVAFTDADCIPAGDWLVNLSREFDDGIVGVGGGVKNIGKGLWIQSINLAYETFLGSANSIQGRFFKNKRFVSSISGCNSMYCMEDILKVGGFNVSLPGAEDAELNKRLLKKGNLLYTPNAVIFHDHRRGLGEFAKQMLRYGRDRAVARRWGLQVIPPLVVPLLFLSVLFTRWILLSLLSLYLVMVVIMGFKFVIQERNIKYLVSVPIVFAIEHSLYTLGFWKGFVRQK